jgi:hypothetical protein
MHTSRVSEHVRIGLGILAAAWFFPVLAWAFLALLSEARRDAASVLLLVHRGVPALILLAAVISSSWALVVAEFSTGVLTALAALYCGPIDQTEIVRGWRQSTAPFPK